MKRQHIKKQKVNTKKIRRRVKKEIKGLEFGMIINFDGNLFKGEDETKTITETRTTFPLVHGVDQGQEKNTIETFKNLAIDLREITGIKTTSTSLITIGGITTKEIITLKRTEHKVRKILIIYLMRLEV